MLTAGYHPVADGDLATVVTHLEMRSQPDLGDVAFPSGLALRWVREAKPDWYRALFTLIGSDWLWMSRLTLSDRDLGKILASEQIEIWTLTQDGQDLALCEIRHYQDRRAELSFLGLEARLQGQGVARPLMAHACARAFSRPIDRFTVHTCTLDHPSALPFYMRSGFQPIRRDIEIIADPRLRGLLPETAAPQIPLIRPGQ